MQKHLTEKHFAHRSSLVKFRWLFEIKNFYVKLGIAVLLGLILSLATTLFIKNTSLYSGGTSAFFYGIARVVHTYLWIDLEDGKTNLTETQINLIYNALFWGLYLLMNIPLAIFSYFKISKKFAVLSMTFLVANQLFGFMWGTIPNFYFNIFGDTEGVNAYLHNYKVDTVVFHPNIIPLDSNEHVTINWMNPTNWVYANKVQGDPDQLSRAHVITSIVASENYVKAISLTLYAVVFSFLSATATAFLFIMGGSSAGSDFIVIAVANEKHGDVGKIYTLINATFMVTGTILGNYVSGILVGADLVNNPLYANITTNPFSDISYLVNANLMCSLIWIICNGAIIGRLFPSAKSVKVEISTQKTKIVERGILNIAKQNNLHLFVLKGEENEEENKGVGTIKFVCNYFDYTQVLAEARTLDKNALVTSSFITDIDGPIDLYKKVH